MTVHAPTELVCDIAVDLAFLQTLTLIRSGFLPSTAGLPATAPASHLRGISTLRTPTKPPTKGMLEKERHGSTGLAASPQEEP